MWVKDKYRVISRSLASLREALGREPTSKELADRVLVDTDSKVGEGQGGRGVRSGFLVCVDLRLWRLTCNSL